LFDDGENMVKNPYLISTKSETIANTGRVILDGEFCF
jgi:hypothetical protein